MSFHRTLFFDGCNLNSPVIDCVNNYSRIPSATVVHKKGDIIKALKDGRKYQLITIAGHGAKDEISVGSGMQSSDNPRMEISLKKFDQSLLFFKCLKKHLDTEHSTPIVFLAGCEIYDCMDSHEKSSLLWRISTVMKDVLVIAPSTLIRPALKSNAVKIKFEFKPGKEADFDFYLTLGAFRNGTRIDEISTILELTKCTSEEELHKYLCRWEMKI
ncbi:hypothetical protein [Estrella lausannensis]|uniref:Uncharacterized protein n=1 Tax=Estrella lausannensis TaxID=483423 RepID=A0A0H5DTP8_9BACT|nr:hypothetical protein [Estrella lausannensis]CRX39249.1 Hypothetical protein ELAC_1924 [Estrella lausannensis]